MKPKYYDVTGPKLGQDDFELFLGDFLPNSVLKDRYFKK
jgi:hypothetical protein